MAKQHVLIFRALGIPQATIDKIEALKEEELKDWKPDEYVGEINTLAKTKLENDPTFLNAIPEDKIPDATKKKIEKGQYARFQNELFDVAKKLNLTDKDISEEDKKSIKGIAEKIAVAYLANNNSTEGLKKMQADLAEARQQVEAANTTWQKKFDDGIAAEKNSSQSKLMRLVFQSSLGSLPKIKLMAPPEYLTDRLLTKMNSQFNLVLGEGEQIFLKQKENAALDVIDKTGKKIGFNDALREMVIAEKIGEEIVEDPGKKKTVIVQPNPGDPSEVGVASYIQEAAGAIQQMEEKT